MFEDSKYAVTIANEIRKQSKLTSLLKDISDTIYPLETSILSYEYKSGGSLNQLDLSKRFYLFFICGF